MLLDKNYYEEFIIIFEKFVKEIFKENMIILSRETNLRNRGFFRISYMYLPQNYKIIIENELRTFDIMIVDSEGASNVLYRIEHFENSLDKDNIENSIILLKKVLERNDFNFYIQINDKVYRKNANGIKRIKDLKELLNG